MRYYHAGGAGYRGHAQACAERARLGGFGVAADVWFATITRKIDAMKGWKTNWPMAFTSRC